LNGGVRITTVAIVASIYHKPSDTERGVARVRLSKIGGAYTGQPAWFLYLPNNRLVDVTMGPDAALCVADYQNGEIDRIVYNMFIQISMR
jgi:hypothetical protein